MLARVTARVSRAFQPLAQPARFASSAIASKRVAVVLSGSGVYDGTEITEAVSVFVRLAQRDIEYECFAPEKASMHTINHLTGEPEQSTRNVLAESARIARGQVTPVRNLNPSDFAGVIFPGGFGAAKNLSTFAVDGAEMEVDSEVERVLDYFHASGKPIGLCCIAPVLAAKVLGKHGVEVTMGGATESEEWPFAGAAGAVEAWGAKHVEKPVTEAHVDEANKVVTSPAYMCGTASADQIFTSVGAMVDGVVERLHA